VATVVRNKSKTLVLRMEALVGQWFLTWGKFTPVVNFIFQGGKFTEP